MKIGRMNRQVSVRRQVPTGETDSLNQPITAPQTVATFWAQLTPKSADERFATEQRYAERLVTFRTWWRDDISETDTLVCDGLSYNIKAITEVGFRELIDITAEWQD